MDGGFEVHLEGEQPIVAGYLFDEPRDIVIDVAHLDADGNLSLLGEDKEVRDGKYDIEPSDIFGGQLDYVTSSIGAWMKEEARRATISAWLNTSPRVVWCLWKAH